MPVAKPLQLTVLYEVKLSTPCTAGHTKYTFKPVVAKAVVCVGYFVKQTICAHRHALHHRENKREGRLGRLILGCMNILFVCV